MRGSELAELSIFLAVAKHRSFRRTATERGVASSAISHAMRTLEERIGVRLLNRTTRSVSLTEAGARFLADLGPAFDQIAKAHDGLNEFRGSAYGTLRVNVPMSLAPLVLGDVLVPLTRAHPGLKLDIVASDALVDIVEDGFDAGIRLGEKLTQDMIAVRIARTARFTVIGAPTYLAGRQLPKHPRDLADHVCIRYRFPSGKMFDWEFGRGGRSAGGRRRRADHARQPGDDGRSGLGGLRARLRLERIAPRPLSKQAGSCPCLADWCPEIDDLFIYCSSRRHVSAGLRALIDILKA